MTRRDRRVIDLVLVRDVVESLRRMYGHLSRRELVRLVLRLRAARTIDQAQRAYADADLLGGTGAPW